MAKLQPAVKKETKNVTLITLAGTIVMLIVFLVLHFLMPETVPFDYTVILGAVGGLAVAVLNFFLMAVTVQAIAGEEDEGKARNFMKMSYTRRMLMQIAWIVVSILVPCFQFIAGIVPLLFPGIGIKVLGIIQAKNNKTGGEA